MIVHLNKDTILVTRTAANEFFEESQLPGALDFHYWVKRWGEVFDMKMGTIIAYMNDGELKGFMGALIFPCWMTGHTEALEAFWYVRKPYRGTTIGIKILKEYERWARERGAVRVKMVHLEVINADMLEKIYLRMGYSKLERVYSKELQ
jgi:GNAT superfamily N-acetyltransferase